MNDACAPSVKAAKDWHFSVSKNFVLNNTLSVGSRLLLIALKSFVGTESDSCFPGIEMLSDRLGVNKETLGKWRRELIDKGYLEVSQLKEDGKFSRNLYVISETPGSPKESPQPEIPASVPSVSANQPLRVPTIQDLPLNKGTPPLKEEENITEETIYKAYPKKVGKPDALKAIRRKVRTSCAPALLAATKAFAALWEGAEDLSFCPNPSTWFNQDRFNDHPSTWSRPKAEHPAQELNRLENAIARHPCNPEYVGHKPDASQEQRDAYKAMKLRIKALTGTMR